MTKVSSFPQTVWHWFANHAISPVRHTLLTDLTASAMHRLQQLGRRCVRIFKRQGLGVWVCALVGTLLLMVWNGVLLLALSIGLGTALLIQRLHPRYTIPWQAIAKGFSGSHSTTLLSIGCGLLSLVASYMTVLIWQDTSSFWLAFAILLQGLGLLTVLGLFLWQMVKPDKQRLTPTYLDDSIHNLTAIDPLKRLIAVRQINQFVASTPSDRGRVQELREYLQLLLQKESETSIQNAITEGLEMMATLR